MQTSRLSALLQSRSKSCLRPVPLPSRASLSVPLLQSPQIGSLLSSDRSREAVCYLGHSHLSTGSSAQEDSTPGGDGRTGGPQARSLAPACLLHLFAPWAQGGPASQGAARSQQPQTTRPTSCRTEGQPAETLPSILHAVTAADTAPGQGTRTCSRSRDGFAHLSHNCDQLFPSSSDSQRTLVRQRPQEVPETHIL